MAQLDRSTRGSAPAAEAGTDCFLCYLRRALTVSVSTIASRSRSLYRGCPSSGLAGTKPDPALGNIGLGSHHK